MNPILLDLGYDPEIAAAISGFLVLFTSSSTSSQFIVMGAMDLKEAVWFTIFSSVGSLIGNIVIYRLIQKYKKPSLLVWILFFLFVSSLLILPTLGIYSVIQQGRLFQFSSPC